MDPTITATEVSLQYHRHTLVPIGANFQAVIPPMMTEEAYKAKSSDVMRVLRILKINDPEEGEAFEKQYLSLVNEKLGPDRTYEDLNMLQNAFKKLNSRCSFEDYLNKHLKYW